MTVYGVQSINYNPKTPVGAKNDAAQDPQAQEMDFLKLLISQISNQTPDSPMDPTAMITQYSQMQAALGLVKLNASSMIYQNSTLASSLIEQKVRIKEAFGDDVSFIEGKVSAVDFSTDVPRLKVDGTYYPLTDVIHIGE